MPRSSSDTTIDRDQLQDHGDDTPHDKVEKCRGRGEQRGERDCQRKERTAEHGRGRSVAAAQQLLFAKRRNGQVDEQADDQQREADAELQKQHRQPAANRAQHRDGRFRCRVHLSLRQPVSGTLGSVSACRVDIDAGVDLDPGLTGRLDRAYQDVLGLRRRRRRAARSAVQHRLHLPLLGAVDELAGLLDPARRNAGLARPPDPAVYLAVLGLERRPADQPSPGSSQNPHSCWSAGLTSSSIVK